jgi:GNAT superfamily N-acetyltransferase
LGDPEVEAEENRPVRLDAEGRPAEDRAGCVESKPSAAAVSAVTADVHIREGLSTDDVALLNMWDRAVAWLVARGQAMQWGTQPGSHQPRVREYVRGWVQGPGLRIAELDGQPVGASVIVDTPPEHIPPISRRETYLLFLISDRDHAGNGIGAQLVRRAATDARAAGSEVLRVDCWAGAPDLVTWYGRQGFVRSGNFTVDVRGGWDGQVFEMTL